MSRLSVSGPGIAQSPRPSVIPPRPTLPAQPVSRTHWGKRDRQIRVLSWPLRRIQVAWQDSHWSRGPKLRTHVVMCGFPRSGTTLCQLMAQSCVKDLTCFPREVCGLDAAQFAPRRHEIMLTKRPRDVFLIPEIREFFRTHPAQVRFVLITRDPRAVLTSMHPAKPDRYFISIELWRAIYEHWKWSALWDDTVVVRFEELVRDPKVIEERLARFIGWQVHHPFADYYSVAQPDFNIRPLNGLRPPDPKNIDRWRAEKYRDRIVSLLTTELPELPQVLVEMGYEPDDSWTRSYLESSRP